MAGRSRQDAGAPADAVGPFASYLGKGEAFAAAVDSGRLVAQTGL
jgi:hypothetical protein